MEVTGLPSPGKRITVSSERLRAGGCGPVTSGHSVREGDVVTFDEWIVAGMAAGWVSAQVCALHDGVPTTAAEDDRIDAGYDPCVFVVRVFGDDGQTRRAVEVNTRAGGVLTL